MMHQTVIINFPGGIISPGYMNNILIAASRSKIREVRFGLRQQLLIDIMPYTLPAFTVELDKLGVFYTIDTDHYPNVISSYPAADIFTNQGWLSEGVYKDILDGINFRPKLKVNICHNDQSFTPMLTGNINWIASSESEHYWHLFIRFPKTNVIYEWDQVCYTNHVANLTEVIEKTILSRPSLFVDNSEASGPLLFSMIRTSDYILKTAAATAILPAFQLPYYEGLNRYNDKYWLGIYRRDEFFDIAFLKRICKLCLDTKLGQLCCTSWKTVIVKGIEEKDKSLWNGLLEEFKVNMRHAANELNFQVEDNCAEGLALKQYLLKYLGNDDTRTFGICFGIKTRQKSEVFSNILIRRRYLINFIGIRLFAVYDILCARDFNPHERTGEIYSSGNPGFILPEQLRRAVLKFYAHRANLSNVSTKAPTLRNEPVLIFQNPIYQCTDCLSVYDQDLGAPDQQIAAGTAFEALPEAYTCPLCDGDKSLYNEVDREVLA